MNNPWSLRPSECAALASRIEHGWNESAATSLGVSSRTVEGHLQNARKRMNAPSVLTAAVWFDRFARNGVAPDGWVMPPPEPPKPTTTSRVEDYLRQAQSAVDRGEIATALGLSLTNTSNSLAALARAGIAECDSLGRYARWSLVVAGKPKRRPVNSVFELGERA